jgi:hypothetical protein
VQRLAGRALALLACDNMLVRSQRGPNANATTNSRHLKTDVACTTGGTPVHRARKFSAVFGTTSLRSCEASSNADGLCRYVSGTSAGTFAVTMCKTSCCLSVSGRSQRPTSIVMRPRGAPSAVMSKKTTAYQATHIACQSFCTRSTDDGRHVCTRSVMHKVHCVARHQTHCRQGVVLWRAQQQGRKTQTWVRHGDERGSFDLITSQWGDASGGTGLRLVAEEDTCVRTQ